MVLKIADPVTHADNELVEPKSSEAPVGDEKSTKAPPKNKPDIVYKVQYRNGLLEQIVYARESEGPIAVGSQGPGQLPVLELITDIQTNATAHYGEQLEDPPQSVIDVGKSTLKNQLARHHQCPTESRGILSGTEFLRRVNIGVRALRRSHSPWERVSIISWDVRPQRHSVAGRILRTRKEHLWASCSSTKLPKPESRSLDCSRKATLQKRLCDLRHVVDASSARNHGVLPE